LVCLKVLKIKGRTNMVLEKDRGEDAGHLGMQATEGRGLITHPSGVRAVRLPSKLGASRVNRER